MALPTALKNKMLDIIKTDQNAIWLEDDQANGVSDTKDFDLAQWGGFNDASGGSIAFASPVVFSVGAGETVHNIVINAQGNEYYIYIPVTPETFTNAGTYTLNSLTITLS